MSHLIISGGESIDLSTSSHTIEVNKSVTLNCSSHTFEATGVRFYNNTESDRNTEPIVIFFQSKGKCNAPGVEKIPFTFSFHCLNSTLFSLEIQKVTMDLHNSSLNCELYNNTQTSDKSRDVVIEVAGEYIFVSLGICLIQLPNLMQKGFFSLNGQSDSITAFGSK